MAPAACGWRTKWGTELGRAKRRGPGAPGRVKPQRWPAGDPPVHAGLIPWDLVKRVTSVQDRQSQLVGQGPVSELGVQHERLSPTPSRHHLPPPALDRGLGWPGGALAGAGGAGLCSVTLTGPQLKLYEGQGQDRAGPLLWVCKSRGWGTWAAGSPGPLTRRAPAAGWARPRRTAPPGRSRPWAAAAGGVAPTWGAHGVSR